MHKKLVYLSTSLIFLLVLLNIRVYIVGRDMKIKEEEANTQKEKVCDVSSNLLDRKNNTLLKFEKEYYLVFDSKTFRLNHPKTSLEELLALNYIMKSNDDTFSLGNLFKNTHKEYIKINEDTYKKLEQIKDIKGIYTFSKDVLENKEAWKIENILTNYYKNNDNENGKKELKDKGSIEEFLYSYTKDNSTIYKNFYLDDKAIYTSSENEKYNKNTNVKTTLDLEWQKKVRDVLNRKDFSNIKNAGVAVIEAESGKVLVLAQKDESQKNVLLGGFQGYEPGSIFKILTEEEILEKGTVDPSQKIVCNGDACSKNNKPHPHGAVDMRQALKVSCNNYFQKSSVKSGYERWEDIYKFASNQGVFSKVLDFSDEVKGDIDKNIKGDNESNLQEEKSSGESTNLVIGQSMLTTPIQMVGIMSPVINNGVYVKPYIIDSLTNGDGTTKKVFTSQTKKRVIKKETALKVKSDLKSVVDYGSGINAKVEGIDIGGKTGTATAGDINHGCFLGYFNLNQKYYSMIVFVPEMSVENNEGESLLGGNTAAPIFKNVVLELSKK